MTLPASRRRLVAAFASLCAVGVLTASCASPSLTLYTLGLPSAASDTAPLGAKPVVIEVRRVAIPDYLDSQDIVVRDGTILVRSTQGRWASRVSLGVTHFLTARLARRRPDALITDQPQIESPNFRLFVTISTLDITSGGTATLDADWLIVPRDPAQPTRRARGHFTSTGPVATDQDVVSLTMAVLQQLADAIDIGSLR
jgi:uncharacterized lipoprotein YmbA